jgi:branched-subunit amino acid transport protein
MNAWDAGLAIAGLAVITIFSRGLFLLPDREWPLPGWLREALRHAPVAALAAVVVPAIVLGDDGRLVSSWADAKLVAALVASGYFLWRREILGTIVSGTATLVALRLGLGW